MVTTVNGAPFNSIIYLNGISINSIANYMGATITPPLPDYMYLVGAFQSYKSPVYTRILRTDLSGNVDTTFNMGAGANNNVLTMVTQSDGKILIGGLFTAYSGSTNQSMVRINTNGTKDTTFNIGSNGFNGNVYDIKVRPNGKIIAVGTFTSYSGSTRNRIVQINEDGTIDSTLNVGTGLGGVAYAVGIQSDGKLIVGGEFTTYRGSTSNRLVRIYTNGTLDTTFNVGTGLTSTGVYGITIQSDDKVLISHGTTTYSGSTVTRLTRLNTDGTIDSTFNPGVINSTVVSSRIQSDGKIVFMGLFNSVSGSVRAGLARVQSNGNLDTSYNVGLGGINGNTAATNGISFDTSGNVYVGGSGTSYSGSTVNYFVKTTNSGSIDTTFNTGSVPWNNQTTRGFNTFVWATMVSASSLYTAGSFTLYDAPRYTRIIKLDNTGSVDTTFNMGTGFSNTIYCMITQSDAKLVVGGDFTSYSGSTRNRIARVNTDGTLDTIFNPGAGTNGSVYDLKIQSDGKIVAVGNFTTYSGSSSSGIVRINTNGTRDTTFNIGTGFSGVPNAITMQSDGKLIAVGTMTNYSGSAITRIVRINTDGTRDLTYNAGTGLSNTAYSIAIQSDDKTIVGGDFVTYSGSSVNRLVKINTDGTRDLSFSPGTGQNGGIYSLKLLSNDSLLVAGVFTTYSGSTANRLVKINSNGSRDNSFVVGTGPSGWGSNSVGAISLDKNNNPYIASNFTTYSGSSARHIAKLKSNGNIDSTFNIGTLIFNDTGTGFDTLPYSILNIIT